MDDIKLLETCPHCGENLTLMLSINTSEYKPYLIKRCLSCLNYSVTEVIEITPNLHCPVFSFHDIRNIKTNSLLNLEHDLNNLNKIMTDIGMKLNKVNEE